MKRVHFHQIFRSHDTNSEIIPIMRLPRINSLLKSWCSNHCLFYWLFSPNSDCWEQIYEISNKINCKSREDTKYWIAFSKITEKKSKIPEFEKEVKPGKKRVKSYGIKRNLNCKLQKNLGASQILENELKTINLPQLIAKARFHIRY